MANVQHIQSRADVPSGQKHVLVVIGNADDIARQGDSFTVTVKSDMPDNLFEAHLETAIGDAKEKGAGALEAFSYHYPEGESTYERFRVHRTVFPRDFLADFGFRTLRHSGRVELARLELGGLQWAAEPAREKVLRVVKEALAPVPPIPQRP